MDMRPGERRRVMKITTLIENTNGEGEGLVPEHGLSLLISFQGSDILFDTGASDSFAKNAEKLDVNLKSVRAAVISHHHYDHAGGLHRFFVLNSDAKVYLGVPPDGDPYFKALGLIKRHVGLEAGLLDTYSDRFVFVDAFSEILPNVFIHPHIVHNHPRPKGNRYLFVRKGAEWRLDDFKHELVMAIIENGELVIFTGCSHSGMINMIDTVTQEFPGIPVKAVIGGFHLMGLPYLNTMAGSRSEVEGIGREILMYPVEATYTGHCTGKKAFDVLKGVMGDQLHALHTGMRIAL
jgi:7,8-dihydropterin-6-yl-methyl-4-(beta-D-ribofuranosyl)aminobenzene 5'-phosphate synthase